MSDKDFHRSQLHYDIAEYLLRHGDDLKEDITSHLIDISGLFSGQYIDLYIHNYEVGVIRELQNIVRESFNLNSEEINLIVNKEFVTLILGGQFLKPLN